MNKEQQERLKTSIKYAEEALAKGLIQPSEALQLRRMIAYYREKLKAEAEAALKEAQHE